MFPQELSKKNRMMAALCADVPAMGSASGDHGTQSESTADGLMGTQGRAWIGGWKARKDRLCELQKLSCMPAEGNMIWAKEFLKFSMHLWPWNSPGKNPGVDSLSLLQGIFLTPRFKVESPTF